MEQAGSDAVSVGTTPAVSLEDVAYRYPGAAGTERRGVAGVNLTLPQGEVLGLLGPNGSGKSTLLSLVAGFLEPETGSVRVLGETVSAAVRRRVGMVLQDASVDPLMTVEETLRLHGRLFGVRGSRLQERSRALLAWMGLSDRARDPVETLSGGLRRRVELARAVLHEPAVLLLDEPSLGLDPDSRGGLWDLLDGVRAEGAALLLATNDVTEAERVCDRVAFLQAGRVVAVGAPSELKRELRHDSVRVEWPAAPDDVRLRLGKMTGVGAVRTASMPDGGAVFHVTVDDASAFVPALFALAATEAAAVESAADGRGQEGRAAGGPGISGIQIHESTLEDAYFQQVGSPLGTAPESNGTGPATRRRS